MKVLIFCATNEDRELYPKYIPDDIELTFEAESLTIDNEDKTKGFEAVVVLTRCLINEVLADALKRNGIKYVLTRSAGYDHIDAEALNKRGILVANVPVYSPNAIAEYVCMTALMSIRKMKLQSRMIDNYDFTLSQIRGRELRNLTFGIIGTGRIGMETLKILSAFSENILLYDIYQKDEAKEYGTYVTMDQIYRKSDLIIYHCPLTKENKYMLDDDALALMKDGVVLINPARGGLWNYETVLKGVESGKIASAVFDVYESEKNYLRKKLETDEILDPVLRRLLKKENVIYTAHSAFYTDTAIENMIEVTANNLKEFSTDGHCKNEC